LPIGLPRCGDKFGHEHAPRRVSGEAQPRALVTAFLALSDKRAMRDCEWDRGLRWHRRCTLSKTLNRMWPCWCST